MADNEGNVEFVEELNEEKTTEITETQSTNEDIQ